MDTWLAVTKTDDRLCCLMNRSIDEILIPSSSKPITFRANDLVKPVLWSSMNGMCSTETSSNILGSVVRIQ